MRMSDAVAAYIIKCMNASADGSVELQRNTLATQIGCAPSQINYVLSSRFTPQHGYVVESRRGGGGYIRITRIHFDTKRTLLAHLIRTLPDTLSEATADSLIMRLLQEHVISSQTARAMMAAVSDKALAIVNPTDRNLLRGTVLRYMIASVQMDSNSIE